MGLDDVASFFLTVDWDFVRKRSNNRLVDYTHFILLFVEPPQDD